MISPCSPVSLTAGTGPGDSRSWSLPSRAKCTPTGRPEGALWGRKLTGGRLLAHQCPVPRGHDQELGLCSKQDGKLVSLETIPSCETAVKSRCGCKLLHGPLCSQGLGRPGTGPALAWQASRGGCNLPVSAPRWCDMRSSACRRTPVRPGQSPFTPTAPFTPDSVSAWMVSCTIAVIIPLLPGNLSLGS